MKTIPLQFRQGDVLIERVDSIPNKYKKIEGERIVIAHGEVTGHAHALQAGCVAGYHPTETTPETEADYIEVTEALAGITHEEHATIDVPVAGCYQIIHQREYSPAEIRRVQD